MTLRIGNAAGFWGDQLDAPERLVEQTRLDYLTLEYLAELTMSILARLREKDPTAGYAHDFVELLPRLTTALADKYPLKVVTNAGGVNPRACVVAAARKLVEAGLGAISLGMVEGDDLLRRLDELQALGEPLANLDTGAPLSSLRQKIVSANAYLGAREITACLQAGAQIVVTGRVADASLTVGPAMHEFGWSWTDWDKLAAASVAGHLIECGAQATGGFSPFWTQFDLARVGFPIAELDVDGSVAITKPTETGGAVTIETVAEQLVYEIGDPAHYLTPDVDVDFTTISLQTAGVDRVAVVGATGRPAPATLKVSLAYQDGYTASGQLLVYGRDCVPKAQECARIILARLHDAGCDYARSYVECLGTGDSVPGLHTPPRDLREVLLRVTVHDPRRDAVERFTREFAPLATGGPAGLAGYTAARGTTRPVFAYWPTLVSRDQVRARYEVRTAADWLVDGSGATWWEA